MLYTEDEFPEIRDILRSNMQQRAEASLELSGTGAAPTHSLRLTVRATMFDGKSVYIRKKLKKFTSPTMVSIAVVKSWDCKVTQALLIEDRYTAEDRQLIECTHSSSFGRALLNGSAEIVYSVRNVLPCSPYSTDIYYIKRDNDPTPQASTSSSDSMLWVDRYRPKRFTDLLGDDRIHREVMSWLKEWDYCVFGKRKGKKRARDDDNPDEFRRPKERVSDW